MDKIEHCHNHNRFAVIDTEELTALELIHKNIDKTNEIVDDNKKLWEEKTDKNGDHKGSWHGIEKPTMAQEGLASVVESMLKFPKLDHEVGVENIAYPYGDVRRFGAQGDGKTDDTIAFKNAIKSLGNIWSNLASTLYIPCGVYLLNEELLIERDNLTIKGDGIEQTILKLNNCNGIVTTGTFKKTRYGVVIKDLAIIGGNIALKLEYMALNCTIENISIQDTKSYGVYIHSSFDFCMINVVCRNCRASGFFIDQLENPFEEISYITFTRCNAIKCDLDNVEKVQWKVKGGNNLYFNDCKANEGDIGIHFSGNNWSNRITNFYMDGLNAESTVVFCVDGTDIRNLTINNVYTWNCKTIVQLKHARSVICSNLDVNPSSWATQAFKIENTFTGILNIDNKNYVYENKVDRSFSSPLNILDTTDVKIMNRAETIGFLSGYTEALYEFTLLPTYTIIGMYANIVGNNKVPTANGTKTIVPIVDYKDGYGYVKVKTVGGETCNSPTNIKVNVMLLIKINKPYT